MKKQLLITLTLIIVFLVSLSGGPFTANAQTNTTLITQLKAKVVELLDQLRRLQQPAPSVVLDPLTQTEIAEIRNIREKLAGSNGHDYSELYRSLVSRRGDLTKITQICSRDALNGVKKLPIYSTDIDRSSATAPADILALVDLLNAGWNGEVLPPCPSGIGSISSPNR